MMSAVVCDTTGPLIKSHKNQNNPRMWFGSILEKISCGFLLFTLHEIRSSDSGLWCEQGLSDKNHHVQRHHYLHTQLFSSETDASIFVRWLCNIQTPVQQRPSGRYLTVRADCRLQPMTLLRSRWKKPLQHVVGDGRRRVITMVTDKRGNL